MTDKNNNWERELLVEEANQYLQKLLEESPHRFVFSAPAKGGAYRKATVTALGDGEWQTERLTDTQAFHHNFQQEELPAELLQLLEDFTQLTALSETKEIRLRLTKKGKVLYSVGQGGAVARPAGHDREKTRIFKEGIVVPPLVDVGVMDKEGRILAAKRDKYRQINRFIELVEDALPEGPLPRLRIVDFGCGKSYLTFLLYHYLTEIRQTEVEMTGLDLKADVVAACNTAAEKYGYRGLSFAVGDVAQYELQGDADMVVTLHACDTATDYALARAVAWNSGWIFSVPCCQHELNAQIRSDEFALLTRYGIVKERVAALMTDAIRANLLTACGYETQLLEFVDFEHTPKNIMIRASRKNIPVKTQTKALEEAKSLCKEFHLSPCLLGLLQASRHLPPEN